MWLSRSLSTLSVADAYREFGTGTSLMIGVPNGGRVDLLPENGATEGVSSP